MASGTCDRIESLGTTPRGWHADAWRALRARALTLLGDEALVLRARAGEGAAFDTLATRYRDRLYTMALNALGDEDEAGAALREMLVAAYRDIDSVDADRATGVWLHLHGVRVVLRRLGAPHGRYTVLAGPPRG